MATILLVDSGIMRHDQWSVSALRFWRAVRTELANLDPPAGGSQDESQPRRWG